MDFKDIFFYSVIAVLALFAILIGIFTYCMKKGRDKNLQS